MALRNAITKRLYKHLLPSSQKSLPNFHHHLFSSPETSSSTTDSIFFRKQTNRSPRFNQPDFFYIPVGEKLNISDCDPMTKNAPFGSGSGGLSVSDARKMVRCLQLQNVRSAVKMIQANSISYAEFVNVCMDTCGNRDQGVEFAKVLDVSGDVIVLGNVVFLRPDQIAKSMERVISQSMTMPNDPWKQELEELERQMALIDQKAISLVRCELYCGLGLLILQTLVFMRLTFWELSWDVMEPICFFVTSFHFALAYMFFLRTSKEPSFEGYFRQRFRVKRRKLMRTHKFDYKRYNELCNFVYPNYQESKKVEKHAKACEYNQHDFVPLAFDTFGSLVPEAVWFLARVQHVVHNNFSTPQGRGFVFSRLGFSIQKGTQFVACLPAILM